MWNLLAPWIIDNLRASIWHMFWVSASSWLGRWCCGDAQVTSPVTCLMTICHVSAQCFSTTPPFLPLPTYLSSTPYYGGSGRDCRSPPFRFSDLCPIVKMVEMMEQDTPLGKSQVLLNQSMQIKGGTYTLPTKVWSASWLLESRPKKHQNTSNLDNISGYASNFCQWHHLTSDFRQDPKEKQKRSGTITNNGKSGDGYGVSCLQNVAKSLLQSKARYMLDSRGSSVLILGRLSKGGWRIWQGSEHKINLCESFGCKLLKCT